MKILVGIPTIRNDSRFWDSMKTFLPEMEKVHDIEVVEAKGFAIDVARERIVETFLSSNKDYLLFLDDDHSGHTLEMLGALLKPNEQICAIKCYARIFPHRCTLQDYSGIDNIYLKYNAKMNPNGYDFCDLVGFGMTLIKEEVFQLISKPYFVADNNQREDNYFCGKLLSVGIKPLGCFDYVLTHDGIDDSNVKELNEQGRQRYIAQFKQQFPEYQFADDCIIV